jgi:DNA-binding SARP family transcriptional activator
MTVQRTLSAESPGNVPVVDQGLTFRLFGPLQVTTGERPIELGPRKQRAILAMLLMQPGRVLPLDRLISQLWEDQPPASAVTTVQGYVSHLRRTLPDRNVLLTRDPGYLADVAPERIDTARFAAAADAGRAALAAGDPAGAAPLLDRALDEWRGDPLAEFADDEFARPLIAHLVNLRADVVQDRAAARLALGDAGWCVTELSRLVGDAPYAERLWELYAAALYRAGRPADALAAVRQVGERLDEDLARARAGDAAARRHGHPGPPGKSGSGRS